MESEKMERFRNLHGPVLLFRRVIGIAVPIVGVIFIVDLPSFLFRISFFPQQFLGLFLSFIMTYLFLSIPATKSHTKAGVPWYDWLLIVACLASGLYVTLFYPEILITIGVITPLKIVLGVAIIAATLEATRRVAGWPLVIIVLFFILYGRFGFLMPGVFEAKEVSWPRLVNQLYLGSDFLFGIALQIAGLVVFAFVLFGQFLFGTGGANFLLDVAQSLMGKYRGGPAKITIATSALFGTLSGSAVGNVAAVGVVTIPLMKRTGYKASFAGAVEAVSSTGGCILPPIMGAAAFIMASFLGVPYYQVALVAVVPALLYFMGEFLQVDLRAAKVGIKGLPKEQLPSLKQTLISGWIYIIPVVVLVYCLFGLYLLPEVAALYSLGSLILVAFCRRDTRASLKNTLVLLEKTTQGMMEVAIICAAAGIVIGVVTYTGLGLSLSRALVTFGGGNLLLLAFFTAIASTILGMGMPVTATYIFLSVLAAPAMVDLGVPPILAHLFVFYYGTYSFLTPPVCMATFAAASIAGAPLMETAWQGLKLAVAGYLIPFIFIFNPALVFMGEPLEIAWALFDAVVAVVVLAIGVEGYFRRSLSMAERILYILAGLSIVIPVGWMSRIIGLVVVCLLFVYNYYHTSKAKVATGALEKHLT